MSSSPSLKEVVGKDSENASNSSAEGGGNNSDNSALVSLGNASFGFNFESDGVFNTGSGSGSNSPDEGDSDQGDRKMKAKETKAAPTPQSAPASAASSTQAVVKQEATAPQAPQTSSQPQAPPSAKAAAPMSAGAAAARLKAETNALASAGTQQDAAAAAVASLNQIATDAIKKVDEENEDAEKRGLKRKPEESTGYKADQEGEKPNNDESAANAPAPAAGTTATTPGSKKKKLDDSKREERNAREKERSFRISKQINELRTLLSSGGVIVPKGTKSSVLTEAANYIRMLQQHQYRSEIDRHQLVQQVQRIGGGALGPQAAQAVRHVAAQNGVWSLGNFGGVPPKSAMSTIYHPGGAPTADETQSGASTPPGSLSNNVDESDYRHVFNSCTIGMAIASMGGAFIDCNKFFCQISNYNKQEVCSLTVFNLTARQDLQSAFDLISQMLSAPLDPTVTNTSCVLRGALRHRPDVGLSVKLIKGSDGVAKCFCVTLIQNPTSVFDTSRPMPATISVPGQPSPTVKGPNHPALDQTPAYTAG